MVLSVGFPYCHQNTKLDAIEGKTSEDSEDQLLINHGYANLIGSLMYLAIAT